MCKSVTLYGHLTVDRILVDFKETPSLGGIANVWSGLVSQGQGLNVSIQPLSIGHALVLVDKENNYRVGRCSFNVKENPASPTDSDWHHISQFSCVCVVCNAATITFVGVGSCPATHCRQLTAMRR